MARTPIWRSIYGALRAEVVDGSFKAGDKLPTEKELSERFGVNRHTVRRALAELTSTGVISVRRGSGAYVSEGVLDYKICRNRRFSSIVSELGRAPSHRLVSVGEIAADLRVAEQLGIGVGHPVVAVEKIGLADTTPVLFSAHYLPAERFPELASVISETVTVEPALARYGIVGLTRTWVRIAAMSPSRVIARKLSQPDNAPVLRAEAVCVDGSGAPVDYCVSYFAGQRAALFVDLDADDRTDAQRARVAETAVG